VRIHNAHLQNIKSNEKLYQSIYPTRFGTNGILHWNALWHRNPCNRILFIFNLTQNIMTPTQEQKQRFALHQSLIGHHVTLDGYKSMKIVEIFDSLSSMIISIDHLENQMCKNGIHHIGTPEYHSTRTVIDSFKMDIIKKITEL